MSGAALLAAVTELGLVGYHIHPDWLHRELAVVLCSKHAYCVVLPAEQLTSALLRISRVSATQHTSHQVHTRGGENEILQLICLVCQGWMEQGGKGCNVPST